MFTVDVVKGLSIIDLFSYSEITLVFVHSETVESISGEITSRTQQLIQVSSALSFSNKTSSNEILTGK